MARRRELGDVADGMSAIMIRDKPSDKPSDKHLPLTVVGRALKAGHGREYSFDLITGMTQPVSSRMTALARELKVDLEHHLSRRGIRMEWVHEARVELSIGVGAPPQARYAPVRCRVSIVDDLGRTHTSTRRAVSRLPAHSPLARLIDRVLGYS